MLDGFKKFILRGNVVDMAVGVVIGAAFAGVVTAKSVEPGNLATPGAPATPASLTYPANPGPPRVASTSPTADSTVAPTATCAGTVSGERHE